MAEVKLSQESYDELLADIKALRLQADTYFEQWQDAKRKAKAFDEIAVNVLSEDNDVINNMNNIVTKIVINNLERGSDVSRYR